MTEWLIYLLRAKARLGMQFYTTPLFELCMLFASIFDHKNEV